MPLYIVKHDITTMHVDAIVNTTNNDMIGYSGVDLAVHKAAGEELDKVCNDIAPIGVGEAKITSGYSLPCKYVIHTVGPLWRGGLFGESILLRSCYTESLKLAVERGCESIAFPLISSGAYNYPKDQVLKFAVRTVSEFLNDNELTVFICVFDKESYSFSSRLYNDICRFIDADFCDHSKGSESVEPRRSKMRSNRLPNEKACCESIASVCEDDFVSAKGKTLEEYMKSMDKSFQEYLFMLIDESGMTDVECYKRANVDKRTFSKIKNNKNYRPSKQTVVAFAIALSLDIARTQALLATVGFTLSGSSVFDRIISYFIFNGIYDIFQINEALFEFDQILLGSF